MARYTGYCRGCNQGFAAHESDCCPQCGEEMTVAPDSPTVDLTETIPGPVPMDVPAAESDFSQDLIGTQLSLYRIDEFLGRGGMAWVFLGEHRMLQRPCAIKVLRPEMQRRQPDAVRMFMREARAAASLIHPNVVTVHNIGETDTYHFIELEYVPGQSLQGLLNQRQAIPPIEATRYLLQCCAALGAAHRQDLIHRDFKPANILVRQDGTAKLSDFGLAKRVMAAETTCDKGLAGTPYYMAPELFQGRPGSKSSDVYAVAVSYYYLLTGKFPYASRNLARLGDLHAHQPIPDPREISSSIPAEAVGVIARGLSKRPEDRFEDGVEMHGRLQSIYNGLKTLPSLVTEATEDLDTAIELVSDHVRVVVKLRNGRTQTVYVEEGKSEPWSTSIVRVFSICGPVDDQYCRRALELNAQIPHGSLAIEQVGDTPHFVMLNCHLRASCDPVEIRQSIQDIARWADDVEMALTGEDRF